MYIEQLYTNCLAEAAYYIESNGESAVIDPIRETEQYLALAKKRGAKIRFVFETHFHADFVSGHLDLAKAAGAPIVFGPNAETDYDIYSAKDGEEFRIGDITIRALHTPGHTPESTCYLLLDELGKPHALFSGDTLFVGDVGRPDLLGGTLTKEALAGMMYDSLTTKIAPLDDDLLVYPAHGPGSSCGKNIGKETWSTLGQQKKTNYALQPMSRDSFITTLTTGLSRPPQYYFSDAQINKSGYASLESVLSTNLNAMPVEDVRSAQAEGAVILDTRRAEDFERGFIAGSVFTGLEGTYAWWVGTLIPITTELVIVADEGKEEESILRLARIGFENVRGFLKGGIPAWRAEGLPIQTIESIEPEEYETFAIGKTTIDVRNAGEYANGHLESARLIALGNLPATLPELDYEAAYVVHCAGGYRSMIAASLMIREGFGKVTNVHGGYGKLKNVVKTVVLPEAAVV